MRSTQKDCGRHHRSHLGKLKPCPCRIKDGKNVNKQNNAQKQTFRKPGHVWKVCVLNSPTQAETEPIRLDKVLTSLMIRFPSPRVLGVGN